MIVFYFSAVLIQTKLLLCGTDLQNFCWERSVIHQRQMFGAVGKIPFIFFLFVTHILMNLYHVLSLHLFFCSSSLSKFRRIGINFQPEFKEICEIFLHIRHIVSNKIHRLQLISHLLIIDSPASLLGPPSLQYFFFLEEIGLLVLQSFSPSRLC